MSFAPASLPWLARHELLLAWRDWVAMMTGGRRVRLAGWIIGGLLVFALMQVIAWFTLRPWTELGITIDKPTLSQVDASVEIVKQLAAGQKVSITNGESDNGVTKIPTDFLDPTLVTSANLAEVYGKDPVRGPIATGQG